MGLVVGMKEIINTIYSYILFLFIACWLNVRKILIIFVVKCLHVNSNQFPLDGH